jgi:zinc transport system ATP-binding protein
MTDPVPPLVRLRSVAVAYGNEEVLRDVDLEVRAGELWFLLGPNGSGKTTLLRTLLGMLEPRRGSLWLSPELRGRERIGFVPQLSQVSRSLPTTIREFVSLGLVGVPVPAAERRARLSRALARTGLAGLEDRDYWSLSGGQRQRALVARALIREPLLLVLDEPMNHLDADAEQALLADLLAFNREHGVAIVFVTHDAGLADAHATHVAWFGEGRMLARRHEHAARSAGASPAPDTSSPARRSERRR